MAVATALVGASSTTDATSVSSGSITVPIGALAVMFLLVSGSIRPAAQYSVTCNVANLPGWVPVNRALCSGSANGLYMFVAAALEPVGGARTYTITFGGDTCTGNFVGIWSVSGMVRSGLGAVRQIAIQENGSAAGTPAPVFPVTPLTGNPVFALCGNQTNPAAMTPPTGLTESVDTGWATPTTGIEIARVDSGYTTQTVTWGGASASVFGALCAELDTSILSAADVVPVEAGWGSA